jgi:molybdopterin-containing oxidoreductase family membrane subunit
MIVVVSLHRRYEPSRWGMYYPTFWDWSTLLGSIGLFLVGFLIFFRVFPMIASFEVEKLEETIQRGHEHASNEDQ